MIVELNGNFSFSRYFILTGTSPFWLYSFNRKSQSWISKWCLDLVYGLRLSSRFWNDHFRLISSNLKLPLRIRRFSQILWIIVDKITMEYLVSIYNGLSCINITFTNHFWLFSRKWKSSFWIWRLGSISDLWVSFEFQKQPYWVVFAHFRKADIAILDFKMMPGSDFWSLGIITIPEWPFLAVYQQLDIAISTTRCCNLSCHFGMKMSSGVNFWPMCIISITKIPILGSICSYL